MRFGAIRSSRMINLQVFVFLVSSVLNNELVMVEGLVFKGRIVAYLFMSVSLIHGIPNMCEEGHTNKELPMKF